MKTVNVQLTWPMEAETVEVAGDFNGWVNVPLVKQSDVWAVDIPMEPGCYTFKFLVDGDWVNRPGDELEEDEKGNVNAIIIVEEEDEEEVIENKEETDHLEKEEVAKINDDLDTLTLGNDEEAVKEVATENDVAVDKDVAATAVEDSKTEITEEKKDEAINVDKDVADKSVEDSKMEMAEEKKDDVINVDKDVADKSVEDSKKEIAEEKKEEDEENTPQVSTPVIKPAKKGKTKAAKLHPDDVESPRRVTRNLLAKLGPKN